MTLARSRSIPLRMISAALAGGMRSSFSVRLRRACSSASFTPAGTRALLAMAVADPCPAPLDPPENEIGGPGGRQAQRRLGALGAGLQLGVVHACGHPGAAGNGGGDAARMHHGHAYRTADQLEPQGVGKPSHG